MRICQQVPKKIVSKAHKHWPAMLKSIDALGSLFVYVVLITSIDTVLTDWPSVTDGLLGKDRSWKSVSCEDYLLVVVQHDDVDHRVGLQGVEVCFPISCTSVHPISGARL